MAHRPLRHLAEHRPPSRRRRARAALGLAGIGALAVSSGVLVLQGTRSASADAPGPPDLSTLTGCPGQQNPPAGYTGTYLSHEDPTNVQSNLGKGDIGYMIPFKGTIGSEKGVDGATTSNAGGELVVTSTNPNQPSLIVPHIYGAVCGLIALPELTGFVFSSNVKLAVQADGQSAINAYIGSQPQSAEAYPDSIEALPLSVTFGTISAGVVSQPAHNGGLDASLSGTQSATLDLDGTPGATPNALGTSCPLSLSLSFSTTASADINGVEVSGQPVTGPVMGGQAMVVSNPFTVPAVQAGPTCPAVVAQAVNKLLGLPLPPGRATFVAPFTFDFEINS